MIELNIASLSNLPQYPFDGKLSISFSGGRTSAVMTKILLEKYKDKCETVVTFANTGCEHEDTLRFINACDENWNFNTVWLEAVVYETHGVGVGHKVVNFENASRHGEPFEAFIAKYGIPNPTTPQCTGRLKTDVMQSYLQSIGWCRNPVNYWTAIGIRYDEMDRQSSKKEEMQFVYPLIKWYWDKKRILEYMKQFSWDLRIPEHYGNCVWCWKKTLRKQLTLAQDNPAIFDFPKEMEEKYGTLKTDGYKAAKNGRRTFFRKYMSAEDIIQLSKEPFERFDDPNFQQRLEQSNPQLDNTLDKQSGCAESCDVYSEQEYQ